jgi:hypothetical protein
MEKKQNKKNFLHFRPVHSTQGDKKWVKIFSNKVIKLVQAQTFVAYFGNTRDDHKTRLGTSWTRST